MTELGELNRDEAIDRRRFLRRAGTVAWTTPVIMTVLASRAGAQVCRTLGQTCSATTPMRCCAPLICCTGNSIGTCRQPANTACTSDSECCNRCRSSRCQGG